MRFIRSRNGLMIPLLIGSAWVPWTWLTLLGWVLGVIVYTLLEAKFHRDMHRGGPFFKSHKRHHDNPTPESGCPELWLFGVYYLVLGLVIYLQGPMISGFWLGIVCMLFLYEYIHFLCHTPYKFKTKYGRRIKRNHLKHHHISPNAHYEMLINVKL